MYMTVHWLSYQYRDAATPQVFANTDPHAASEFGLENAEYKIWQQRSKLPNEPTGYAALLRDGGFQSFLWTQFLAAFNDNVYKMIVSVGAVELAANQLLGSRYLAIAGAVFVLPFLLFAGYAGQLADRFSKTRVLQITKAFEIAIMGVGMVALSMRSIDMLLVVLFLLAMQANFFSPAKYGILPEMLSEAQLTRANGLLELTTFAAIVLGTSAGSLPVRALEGRSADARRRAARDRRYRIAHQPLRFAEFPLRAPSVPLQWNPFSEVWTGVKRIRADRPLWLTVAGISYFWFARRALPDDGDPDRKRIAALVGDAHRPAGHGTGRWNRFGEHCRRMDVRRQGRDSGWSRWAPVCSGCVPSGWVLPIRFGDSLLWLAGAGFAGGLFIVPLNAFLQERAEPEEKGRLLATNNFVNMIGVVLASGALYLFHDLLAWTPSHILGALGVLTLAATLYIAWLVPAPLVRLIVWSLAHIFFKIRIVGADNIPKKGGALHHLQPRLLRRRHPDRLRHAAIHSLPDVAAVIRKQVAESVLPPVLGDSDPDPFAAKNRCGRYVTRAPNSKKACWFASSRKAS